MLPAAPTVSPTPTPRKNPTPGIYKSSLPNGKKISLLRVMFTDFCKMDCAYCPNSIYVPRKRYAFKREELADTFMELHQRLAVDGPVSQLRHRRRRDENHTAHG